MNEKNTRVSEGKAGDARGKEKKRAKTSARLENILGMLHGKISPKGGRRISNHLENKSGPVFRRGG